MRIKVLQGTHMHESQAYAKGQTFEATAEEAAVLKAAFPGRFELIPDPAPAAEENANQQVLPPSGTPAPGPSMQLRAPDAIARIKAMETQEELIAFTQGETRKGVQEAAEERFEALRAKE